MTHSISEKALTELFHNFVTHSSEEVKRRLSELIIDAAESRTDQVIEYITDPYSFIHPATSCKINDIVLLQTEALPSNTIAYHTDNNLLIDEKFISAKVVSFNPIKGNYVTVEYLSDENKFTTREIYHSYISIQNLL